MPVGLGPGRLRIGHRPCTVLLSSRRIACHEGSLVYPNTTRARRCAPQPCLSRLAYGNGPPLGRRTFRDDREEDMARDTKQEATDDREPDAADEEQTPDAGEESNGDSSNGQ